MFTTIFYQPLYNALVFLLGVVPGHSIGWAVIFLTIVVKIILLPLYRQVAVTQIKMKELEPELNRLKEAYKENKNKEEQARRMMELYRQNKINPLASFLVVLIQFPIILALFYVFNDSFTLDPELLYSFISLPAATSATIFGLSVAAPSLFLSILTGLTQFFQMKISLPAAPPKTTTPSFQADFARSMHLNMKYFMPVLIVIVAHNLPAAISLYWVTSNIFSIGQEVFIRRRLHLKII